MLETNFEKYRRELTQEQFIDSMILNCDGCPTGSLVCSCDAIIPGNITPFNTIDELFEKNDWIKSVIKESAVLDENYYGRGHNMKLLLGLYYGEPQEKIDSGIIYPVGYVTC